MKQTKQLILKVLKNEARLWNEDKTELNQTKLLDTLDNFGNKEKDLYENIISLLLQEKELKDEFFIKIKDVYVFRTNDFRFFIEENKIDNSYTAYKNRIGLSDGKRFLKDTNDVVLDFPYKDCVLEGGQSSEEGLDIYFEYSEKTEKYEEKKSNRKEIFFNQVLAHDEIDRLFDKKALVNWNRYTKDGEQKVGEIKRDENGVIKENLIIKGNNLLALHSLKEQFTGKVKLIYIDPPYNREAEAFYNDNFHNSSWLVFMKNRLEIAKQLLSNNGFIFIQIDDAQQAYLKVLCDEIFGNNNFVTSIAIQMSTASGLKITHKEKKILKIKEYLLVYSKNKDQISFNPIYVPKNKWDEGYDFYLEKNNSKNVKDWTVKKLNEVLKENNITNKDINDPIFKSFYLKNKNLIWGRGRHHGIPKEIFELSMKNRDNVFEYGIEGERYYAYRGRRLAFLDKTINNCLKEDGGYKEDISILLCDLWSDINTAKLFNEGGVIFPNGKKPEQLLQRIIYLCTEEHDLVLDFFLGSGSTAAVAHKTNRQYIGIEQLDYKENDSVNRLINVINNKDAGGITNGINWKGGGEFVYCEHARWNETAKKQILECKSLDELNKLFDEMYDKYFLNYNLKIKEFKEKVSKEEEFKKLSLDDQKKLFIAMLDNNQMYVNETEMEDKRYGISELDKKTTSKFYYDKQ